MGSLKRAINLYKETNTEKETEEETNENKKESD